eukprot:jgi/Botrbrau1/6758/Bobra.0324s0042.2
MSQFEDSSVGVQICGASVNSSCCPFDATRYRTVQFQLACHATLQSKCYKIQSIKGRALRLQLYGGMINDFGFPEVHLTDFWSNFRVRPHPLLKYITAFEDPLLYKVLRVTLQFEGPCAVPFTIEKQTVLRVSLPVVMESDMNIHSVDVEEIQERPGNGLDLTALATITLILGCYEDAVDVEPRVPFIEWEWSMRQLEEMEARARLRRKWAMVLASIFVGVFSVFCLLRLQGWFAPKRKEDSRFRDVYILPRRTLSRSASAGRPSDPSSSSKWPKVEGVVDVADVEFLKNSNGQNWRLGSGSSGQVFKGLFKGSPVAIKVVESVSSTTASGILKEIAVLSGCRHSHIVQFLGVAFSDKHVLLIMEYMEGGDLKTVLQESDSYSWGKRGPQAAYEIASALAYLHSYNVIHLDVKSDNVLLNRDGHAKLCDVGLTVWLTYLETHVTLPGVSGTMPYMAPEVLVDGHATCAADIYSFGVVLWEIVTGERPRRSCRRAPRVPEECSQDIAELIDRCCAQNSKDRPTAKDIMRFLGEFVDRNEQR